MTYGHPDISAADHDRWYAARTLADLGAVTADWLEGTLASLTGYEPNTGPDDETTELIPVLAAANRGGLVTTVSQPGHDVDADGWRQRAAVHGFADLATCRRLEAAFRGMGVWAYCYDPGADNDGVRKGITLHHAQLITSVSIYDYDDIVETFPDCHPAACAALANAWQVHLVDPDFAANTRLWDTLDAVMAPDGNRSVPRADQ